MSDLAQQLAEATFSKEFFLSSVRNGCEAMLKFFGEELWEIYQGELMDRVMDIYAEKYPAYFEVQVQVFDEVYTPEEQSQLLVLQKTYPWLNEKIVETQRLTAERNVENTQCMMEAVADLTDKFMKEKEEQDDDVLVE